MRKDDDYNNKTGLTLGAQVTVNDDDEDHHGEQGDGAKGGDQAQKFHDFLAPQKSRDDLLSFDEKKHLLIAHKGGHEFRVKKAKDLISDRLQIREKVGNFLQAAHRLGSGGGSGMHNEYKPNPALVNEAQFQGVDRQVSPVSIDNNANTNEAERQEPELKYAQRYTPELTPQNRPTQILSTKLTRS